MKTLRITSWPEQQIDPAPGVVMWQAWLFDDRSIAWGPHPDTRKQLPPEFVLRQLFELDLISAEDVVDFLNRYGPIRRRYDLFFPRRPVASVKRPQAAGMSSEWNLLEDVQRYLMLARTLVDHWLRYRQGGDVEPAWSSASELGWIVDPWHAFKEAINHGLDIYRVRFEIPGLNGTDLTATPHPDLYSAMCLQLFNIAVEDLPVRHCANERCPLPHRAFFRQAGRARFGQHRVNGTVKFCSHRCAQQQMQREYRRRQRQKGSIR